MYILTSMSKDSKEFFEMAEKITDFVNDSFNVKFNVKIESIENKGENEFGTWMKITLTNRKRLLIPIKYNDFKNNFDAICCYLEKKINKGE